MQHTATRTVHVKEGLPVTVRSVYSRFEICSFCMETLIKIVYDKIFQNYMTEFYFVGK